MVNLGPMFSAGLNTVQGNTYANNDARLTLANRAGGEMSQRGIAALQQADSRLESQNVQNNTNQEILHAMFAGNEDARRKKAERREQMMAGGALFVPM